MSLLFKNLISASFSSNESSLPSKIKKRSPLNSFINSEISILCHNNKRKLIVQECTFYIGYFVV